jgi:hypothetical protein
MVSSELKDIDPAFAHISSLLNTFAAAMRSNDAIFVSADP